MSAFWQKCAPRLTRYLLIAVLFMPLVISPSTVFPFIFGKEIVARGLIALALALWLPLALKNPDYRPKRSGLLLAVLGFVGVYFLAAVFGESFYRSFWSTVERMGGLFGLLHWSVFFIMLTAVFRSWPDWEKLLKINLFVSLLVAFYGVLQYFDFNLPFIYLAGKGRIAGTLGNPTFLALYLSLAVFSGAALMTREKKIGWRVFYGLLIIFELTVIALSETRGAFLGISVAILLVSVAWVFIFRLRWQRLLAGLGVLLILGGGALLIFEKDWPAVRWAASRSSVIARVVATSFQGGSVSTRLSSVQTGLAAWQARPVLGWGPENYTLAFSQFVSSDFYDIKYGARGVWFDKAHNQPVEILVTTGLVGFLTYLAIFVVLGLYLYRLFQKEQIYRSFYLLIGAGFLAYFIQLLFLFDTPATILQFFLFLALVNNFYLSHFKSKRQRPVVRSSKKRQGRGLAGSKLWLASGLVLVLTTLILYQYEIRPWQAAQITKQAIEAESTNPAGVLELYQQAEKASAVLTLNNKRHGADFVSQLLANARLSPDQKKAVAQLGIGFAKTNLALAPDYKDKLILARIYVNSSQFLEQAPQLALEAALSAQKAGPNRREHLRVLSFAYFLNGDHQKAKEALLKFKELGGDLSKEDRKYLEQLEERPKEKRSVE